MNSQDVILGILIKRSMSGYEIKQLFQSLFSYFFDASYGTIYPTLGKMETDGLIQKECVQQEGKPNKNVYSITSKGEDAFQTYLNSDLHSDVIRSDFMVRLYFGDLADKDTVIRWLETSIIHQKAQLQRLETDYEKSFENMKPTQKICIQIGLEHTKLKIKLLQQGIHTLRTEL